MGSPSVAKRNAHTKGKRSGRETHSPWETPSLAHLTRDTQERSSRKASPGLPSRWCLPNGRVRLWECLALGRSEIQTLALDGGATALLPWSEGEPNRMDSHGRWDPFVGKLQWIHFAQRPAKRSPDHSTPTQERLSAPHRRCPARECCPSGKETGRRTPCIPSRLPSLAHRTRPNSLARRK